MYTGYIHTHTHTLSLAHPHKHKQIPPPPSSRHTQTHTCTNTRTQIDDNPAPLYTYSHSTYRSTYSEDISKLTLLLSHTHWKKSLADYFKNWNVSFTLFGNTSRRPTQLCHLSCLGKQTERDTSLWSTAILLLLLLWGSPFLVRFLYMWSFFLIQPQR